MMTLVDEERWKRKRLVKFDDMAAVGAVLLCQFYQMSVKRRDFVGRLIRVSELSEQIDHIARRFNYRVAEVSRVHIVKVRPAPPQSYVQRTAAQDQHLRSRTISNEEEMEAEIEPVRRLADSQALKQYLQRKRSSLNLEQPKSTNFLKHTLCDIANPLQPAHDHIIEQIRRRQQDPQMTDNTLARRPTNIKLHKEAMKLLPKLNALNEAEEGNQTKQHRKEERSNKLKDSLREGREEDGRRLPVHLKDSGRLKAETIRYYSRPKAEERDERQMKLRAIKQINKNYCKPFLPPPLLSAQSYIITQSNRTIVSHNSKTAQEVASLTKIMTCLITIEYVQRNALNIELEEVVVGKFQANIGGTTANLQAGQIYSVKQLLYGLMLPSGNDASLALAIWCGYRMLKDEQTVPNVPLHPIFCQPNLSKLKSSSSFCLASSASTHSLERTFKIHCYRRFLSEMNAKALQLGMVKTKYANSHGLLNNLNKSTAFDVALLSTYAMQNPLFKDIVATKHFQSQIDYLKVQVIGEAEGINPQDITPSDNKIASTEVNEASLIIDHCQSKSSLQPPTETSKTDTLLSFPDCPTPILKHPIHWPNTHKLLHRFPQYIGIKTGFTSAAGSCLSSCIQIDGRFFVVVVLGCSRLSARFRQTQILKKWLCKHEKIGKELIRERKKVQEEKEEEQKEEECQQD